MATLKEQDIVLHTKDASGNPVIQLPVTRLENVEGQDTKLVHTTGNETIAGTKTFSASPIAPTPASGDNSTKVATTAFVKALGDGKAPKSHASTGTSYGIGTGSNYGHVKLSDSTSSTSAAASGIAATPKAVKAAYDLANTANTTANKKADDTAVVHKTGVETVAGAKTFTDSPKVERVNPYVDIVQTDITKGTAPSATSYAGVRFGGSEGASDDAKQMGALLHNYYANGANIMRLQVTKPEVGSTETASVSVAFGADGVPYATAPTPANADDDSTKVATTEWVQDRLGADLKGYLPLTGGTMTGQITFDSADVGAVYSDGKDLCLGRATNGSILRLRGQDTNDNAGGFHLRAMDAEGNNWYLIGYADGRLTWGSYDVINAYGGTMQGKLKFLDDGAVWSDGTDLLVGDTSGALLRLRNLENPELPGVFQIRASNGDDKNVYLVGNPDGGLTWNGKNVTIEGDCLPLAGGTMTGAINFKNNNQQKISVDSGGDLLLGDSDVGALLRVRGNSSDSNPGGFQFRAQDANGSHYLIGYPDGKLTWGGKNLLTEASGIPVGTVIAFAPNSAPDGFLLCNGAAVSRTTYAALFKAIGVNYGSGNGSTTFNLPNAIDRVLQGGTNCAYKDAGLPNIWGQTMGSINAGYEAGAFALTGTATNEATPGGSFKFKVVDFSASRSNPIYGSSSTVQPPALVTRMYIKY